MRKLASFVTIKDVIPMEGKDRIVDITMEELGYECIIPKVDAVPGNKIIFIQEGAILPVEEKWEFLRKRCYNEAVDGFIIKPMTMGKKETGERVKSWGLGVTAKDIGLTDAQVVKFSKDEGDALTEFLKIRKYEPAEDASPTSSKKAYPKWVKFCLSHTLTRWIGRIWQRKHQNSGGGFPSDLISKSDETTVQNMKGVLEKYKDSEVYVTAKMEGQSFTVVPTFNGKKMTGAYVCSRNNAYKLECQNTFWDCMRKYKIVEQMKELYKADGQAYIIQGEQVGPGIQENIYNFPDNRWYVFTVKDYNTGKQLPLEKAANVAEYFGLEFVPVLDQYEKMSKLFPDIDTAVAYAEKACWKRGNDYWYLDQKARDNETIWKDYMQHEGVVVRTMDYDKDSNVGCSFKIKNMQYSEKGLKAMAQLGKVVTA